MSAPLARRTTAALATCLLILGGGLTACGGDDGDSAPKSASTEDFCSSLSKLSDIDSDGSTEEQIKQAKDAVGKLADVGTPKGMPDDARSGYEALIDKVKDLDDDASEKDVENLFGETDKEILAFFTYVSKECPDFAG